MSNQTRKTCTMEEMTHCFYDPAKGRTLDGINPHDNRGVWGGKTLEETEAETPGAVVLTFDEAGRLMSDHYRQPVSRITKEKFWEMLEILPPVEWRAGVYAESFKMSEHLSGSITAIYARVGIEDGSEGYFTLTDTFTMKHEKIVELCKAFVEEQSKKTGPFTRLFPERGLAISWNGMSTFNVHMIEDLETDIDCFTNYEATNRGEAEQVMVEWLKAKAK